MTSTREQRDLATKLGINVENETFEVASAMITDLIAPCIKELPSVDVSKNQCILAKALKIKVSNDTMRVASAKIADAIFEKNTNAVEKMSLQKGDIVRQRGKPKSPHQTVSTVKSNGRVYFKGMNCPNSWASKLVKVK